MIQLIGNGYLREKDLENYIFEVRPTFAQLENFNPFYVITAIKTENKIPHKSIQNYSKEICDPQIYYQHLDSNHKTSF